MNDEQLRAIVRDAIARRAAAPAPAADPAPTAGRRHPSHAQFEVPAGADMDGPCVIEPAVACHHCGYCRSYGH